MLELALFFLVVVPAIAVRAQQRGVNKIVYVVALIAGFFLFKVVGDLLFNVLGDRGWGLIFLILPWIWVGGLFLVVEFLTNRGRKTSGTWQCPNCRMFNDLRTLKCLCGTPHEATVETTGDPQ